MGEDLYAAHRPVNLKEMDSGTWWSCRCGECDVAADVQTAFNDAFAHVEAAVAFAQIDGSDA